MTGPVLMPPSDNDEPPQEGGSAKGYLALASIALPVATFVLVLDGPVIATALAAALLVFGAIMLVTAFGVAVATDDANARTKSLARRVEKLEGR